MTYQQFKMMRKLHRQLTAGERAFPLNGPALELLTQISLMVGSPPESDKLFMAVPWRVMAHPEPRRQAAELLEIWLKPWRTRYS